MNKGEREVLANQVETTVNSLLREIKSLFLDKVEKHIDDEDGEAFWVKKSFINGSDIDLAEETLNACAAMYREAGIKNTNPKYMKYSRMTAHVRMDMLPKSLNELLEELEEHEQQDKDNPGTTTEESKTATESKSS